MQNEASNGAVSLQKQLDRVMEVIKVNKLTHPKELPNDHITFSMGMAQDNSILWGIAIPKVDSTHSRAMFGTKDDEILDFMNNVGEVSYTALVQRAVNKVTDKFPALFLLAPFYTREEFHEQAALIMVEKLIDLESGRVELDVTQMLLDGLQTFHAAIVNEINIVLA